MLLFFAAAEHFPYDVLSATGPQALPLQQHVGQRRVHCCGWCPQCELSESFKISSACCGVRYNVERHYFWFTLIVL